MVLSLAKIEALAPDQAALDAARKLLKPATWPTLACDEAGLVWGEAQGFRCNALSGRRFGGRRRLQVHVSQPQISLQAQPRTHVDACGGQGRLRLRNAAAMGQ